MNEEFHFMFTKPKEIVGYQGMKALIKASKMKKQTCGMLFFLFFLFRLGGDFSKDFVLDVVQHLAQFKVMREDLSYLACFPQCTQFQRALWCMVCFIYTV